PAPPEVGEKKYDAESAAMIALLKYGSGVPFNRLKGLQGNLGIPLAASTQWDVLADCAPVFIPIHEALILIAAQGKVIHNDDTTMKVLNLPPLNIPEKIGANKSKAAQRKGVFTSGIVAIGGGRTIALYFTGHKHAGENLADVLKRRAAELGPPIQMCDALSRNVSEDFKTILANCLAHGRRRFIDVVENFPAECRYVLELLGKVYQNDETTRREKMSDRDRLIYHQANSKELMDELEQWMKRQLDDKLVEPNSSLGEAITYMLKHWEPLTLFLVKSGAPLDNNVCERALKKAILHRKNAYFYKTANGARIGDMFMSLIHTCELNKANPFDYLTELQKHAQAAALNPADWTPWNYRQTLSASQSPQNA
ncbi:MAG: transposase, partial [Deltaproteobacteria bacterium]|nr:transposase [Deltaproteobacteria bacterium]